MTKQNRAAAIRVDNVVEIRDVDGKISRYVSIYLWQDGSYEIDSSDLMLDEVEDIKETLVAAQREEIPPFDWIALVEGALAVVPAGSPAWRWLRDFGIWQRKNAAEIAAEYLRTVKEIQTEMDAEKLASSEQCAWCGRTATNHDHGKHMMPFCHGENCQSKYWTAVLKSEDM